MKALHKPYNSYTRYTIHTGYVLKLIPIFYSFCDELLIRQSSLGSNRFVVPPREIPQSWSFHVGQKIGRRGKFFLPISAAN